MVATCDVTWDEPGRMFSEADKASVLQIYVRVIFIRLYQTRKKMANKLKTLEIVQLHTIMAAHCRKGQDGFADYETGWDDTKILEEAEKSYPGSYNLNNVAYMRLQAFVRMRAVVAADPNQALLDRLAALEARVEALEGLYVTTPLSSPRYPVYADGTPVSSGNSGRPRSTPPASLMEVKK